MHHSILQHKIMACGEQNQNKNKWVSHLCSKCLASFCSSTGTTVEPKLPCGADKCQFSLVYSCCFIYLFTYSNHLFYNYWCAAVKLALISHHHHLLMVKCEIVVVVALHCCVYSIKAHILKMFGSLSNIGNHIFNVSSYSLVRVSSLSCFSDFP